MKMPVPYQCRFNSRPLVPVPVPPKCLSFRYNFVTHICQTHGTILYAKLLVIARWVLYIMFIDLAMATLKPGKWCPELAPGVSVNKISQVSSEDVGKIIMLVDNLPIGMRKMYGTILPVIGERAGECLTMNSENSSKAIYGHNVVSEELVTIYSNPAFPERDTRPNTYTLRIVVTDPEVSQLKLDFTHMELGQPNVDGHCLGDTLSVAIVEDNASTLSAVPTLCGRNDRQHNVVIDTIPESEYRWHIIVTQITRLSSHLAAPTGCLQ
ncbi:unnamed protein product, partial [Medioppia subpectinata]